MYLIEPFFKLTALENDIGQQSRLLNAIIDQWRYNGQIIGREIPLYLTEEDGNKVLQCASFVLSKIAFCPRTITKL